VIFDLESPGHVDPLVLEGCHAVVHLAARIPTHHDDIDEATLCWQANAIGTLKLVDAMSKAGVKRLIQTTSANAYAPWIERPDELAPMFPASRIFYLTSKIAQELYANARGFEHGIKVTTLRLSSVYGTESHRAPITVIARQMLDGDTVKLAAGGGFGADFVTDNDVAQALLMVLETGANGPFNVSSGTRSTLRIIADQLADLTGTPQERIIIGDGDLPKADPGFPAIDNAKLLKLGFRPTPLDLGLKTLVNTLRVRVRKDDEA
jgi:UDP-glucose 4-epimerase